MEVSNQTLKFDTEALPENTLLLTRLRGEEQLSGTFRFELELLSTDPKVDLDAVLYKPARVGILQRLGPEQRAFRWFQGALAALEEHEQGHGWVSYRAVLVPDLWRLGEFHRSRVFQGKTIDELVGGVLERSLRLQAGLDFELKLTRTKPGERTKRPVYPEREYVVQYEETDLDFVSRWLEHEGIFYFFENDGTREKVVFADSPAAYKPVLAQGAPYPYRPFGAPRGAASEDAAKTDAEEVLAFRCRTTRQPGEVRLNDYNWRDPALSLATAQAVHGRGTGRQTEYNDHYKTPEQGKALAEVRAQEWSCRATVYSGESTCRAFRPGRRFDLDEHFRGDWNRAYLLTRVVHEASQSINLEASNVTASDYKNAFEAIPADLAFRPRRVTPWPAIHGLMHGRIDGEGTGEVAELDDLGRYKVRLPFDEHAADAAPGKASRWIRMAQPYAGVQAGIHFPLLKGTEVLLGHIDGDPDRPVITGAVPNPETVTPTRSVNPTENRIVTATGNVVHIDDNTDRNGFLFMDANRHFVQDFRRKATSTARVPGGGGGGEPPPAAPAAPAARPAARTSSPSGPEAVVDGLKRLDGLRAADAPADARARAFGELIGLGGAPDERLRAIERLRRAGRRLPARAGEPGGGQGTDADVDYEAFTAIDEYLAACSDTGVEALVDRAMPMLEGKAGKDFEADYQLWARRFNAFIAIAWSEGVGEVTINNCDQYTFVDNSLEVTYGTGGESYAETLGDTKSTTITHGDEDETSLSMGNKVSSSMTLGDETSASINMGAKVSASIDLSTTAETKLAIGTQTAFAITVGAAAEFNINVSAKASANITLSAEAAFNLTIGARTHIDIELGVDLYIKLAAAPAIDLQVAVEDIELKIPDSTEVRLKKMEACLDNTLVNLNRTENALLKTRNELSETQTQLSHTQTQLKKTDTQLNKTGMLLSKSVTALNDSVTALNEDTTVLVNKVTALSNNNTAALHTIQ